MTLTIDDAFRKFKSRLELNEKEQANAVQRHTEVREYLSDRYEISRSFLTGSYARHTHSKPLKDVDIFFELGPKEKPYLSENPSEIIEAFYNALSEKYGAAGVRKQTRSVNVDFGVVVDADDNTDYRVISVDVVPAFSKGEVFEIPDTSRNKWIKTNPEIHATKAVAAHQAFSNEWKGLIRMVKYWNNNKNHGEKPIKPSFLIEVMALECLYGGWKGQFDREIQAFFATLADRIFDEWADPAGLGPPVSSDMDSTRKQRAHELLTRAHRQAAIAIDHIRRGQNGQALHVWRELFGPKFPLS